MSLTADDCRSIIERALSLAKADEGFVSLSGGPEANIRFARNEVTTSGVVEDATLTVRCSFGRRSGSASVNQFGDATLERCVRQAEEIARLAPEDPEHMPLLGPQSYREVDAFDEATMDLPPARRAEVAKGAIDLAKGKKVVIAGFLTTSGGPSAVGNSKGLVGATRSSRVTFSTTARTADAKGSGWAGVNGERFTDLDPLRLAATAVDKAFRSTQPKELAPGEHTVILEPAAMADFLLRAAFSMEARTADEGRSFFAAKGGGNKVGQKVVSDQVTLWTDPGEPRAPGSPFDGEGLPTRKMTFIENGTLTSLNYSRFWAQKQGKEPTPEPQNLVMKGGSGTLDDLVRSTKKGILVTRLWYIRSVDPQTLLYTGLTRDGTFLVENGKIAAAVKNFRWNDSPIAVLSKIDAMAREVRARGSEARGFSILCPAVRTRLVFSSLSEAV